MNGERTGFETVVGCWLWAINPVCGWRWIYSGSQLPHCKDLWRHAQQSASMLEAFMKVCTALGFKATSICKGEHSNQLQR